MANTFVVDSTAIITITPMVKDSGSNVVNKGNPIEISLAQLSSLIATMIGTDGGFLTDAPNDANAYGRSGGEWVQVTAA